MAIKRILPPTESAFAQTARPLRLPLKGGVIVSPLPGRFHAPNHKIRDFFNRPVKGKPVLSTPHPFLHRLR